MGQEDFIKHYSEQYFEFEKVFKKVQQAGKEDRNVSPAVLNEIRYSHRALLLYLQNPESAGAEKHQATAFRGIHTAINDSIVGMFKWSL